jgi:hypothetical protein
MMLSTKLRSLCGAMLLLLLALPAVAAPQYGKNTVTFPAGEPLALRVNCGGSFADAHWFYIDEEKNFWVGDQDYLEGRQWGATGGDGVFRSDKYITLVKDTKAPGMMMAERFGMSKYTFQVPAGNYTVRLHFMEGYHAMYTPGTRVFSVAVNGKPVAEHLDVRQEAGEIAKAILREAKGVTAADGKVEIAFTQETKDQGPLINGIEILGDKPLAAPFALLLGDPEGKGMAQWPDLGKPLFRVNCGMLDFLKGYSYMADGDLVWLADQMWADGKTEYGAVGGGDGDSRSIDDRQTPVSRSIFGFERSNLTAYKFKVPVDGTYRVRVDTAETWKDNTAPGKRVFDIAVGDTAKVENVDPFALGGGMKKPGHVDLPAAKSDASGILEVKFIGGKTPQGPLTNGIEVFRVTP